MVASRNSVRGGKVLINQILCLSFAFEYFCSEYIAFLPAAAEILCVKQEDRLASKVSPLSKSKSYAVIITILFLIILVD